MARRMTEEEKVFQEDNLILDTIYTLSHIRDIDGEDIPAYCFLHEITDTFSLSDDEAIKIAVDGGYKIMKVFANEDVDGGLIIADKDCSTDMIKSDYERFYGTEVEVEEYNRKKGHEYESFDEWTSAKMEKIGHGDEVRFKMNDELEEDTVKVKDGKWTNKGKEVTHGTFRTKKQADAQRRAMFANGYHEGLEENLKTFDNVDDMIKEILGE